MLGSRGGCQGGPGGIYEEDLVDLITAVEIAHSAEVGASRFDDAILRFCYRSSYRSVHGCTLFYHPAVP